VTTQPRLLAPPEIEDFFQGCLFLLIVTGFATLTATGKLDSLSVVFVSLALLLRGYNLIRHRQLNIPERWTSYLGVAYIVVYLVDFFLISQNFVAATVHLVLFGMVVKIFSVQRDRDHIYLSVLAFLEVLSAAILTVDSVFLAAFCSFALIAVLTFISMEMRRSAISATNAGHLRIPGLRTRSRTVSPFQRLALSIARTGLVLVAGMLLAGSVIFFALPRLSYGYLSKLAQQNTLVSGFSDNVNLGEIGRIQQSSQVMMHIRIEGDQSGGYDLLLRGGVLTHFDGHRWTNPPHDVESLVPSYGRRFAVTGRPSELPTDMVRFAGSPIHTIIRYRVTMEPIGTNIIFLVPTARFLSGHFRELAADIDDVVQNVDRDRSTSTYSGISDIARPTPAELNAATGNVPEDLRERYLQVPALDPRIAQLAHQIALHERTPYEKAAAIDRYLSTRYGYTLELPSKDHKDPLAYFLFVRRKGHCEYFASSMAIMLREIGIPSRIVTGFRGGEYNNLTGSYIVRARDAHSWVEAFIPGAGWVTFDPTPAGGPAVITFWTRLQLYTDAMREFWREWVVNYDFSHQQTLTNTTVARSRHSVDRFRRWARERYLYLLNLARRTNDDVSNQPRRYSERAAIVVAAIILLFSLPRIVRALRRSVLARNPASAPQAAATLWYQRMTRLASRRGWHREPSQTPTEFTASITDDELRQLIREFTDRYERARFGNSPEDASSLPEIYHSIETFGRK